MFITEKIYHQLRTIFSLYHTASNCGHRTKKFGTLRAYGEKRLLEYTSKDAPEYCWQCIEKMTIICAWCKRPIFFRDQVTLLSPCLSNDETDYNFQIPDNAIIHDPNKMVLIGCMQCSSAIDLAGRLGFHKMVHVYKFRL